MTTGVGFLDGNVVKLSLESFLEPPLQNREPLLTRLPEEKQADTPKGGPLAQADMSQIKAKLARKVNGQSLTPISLSTARKPKGTVGL